VLALIGSLLPKDRQSSSAAPKEYGPAYIEWLRGLVPEKDIEGISVKQYDPTSAVSLQMTRHISMLPF
jgi:hypothetical protein